MSLHQTILRLLRDCIPADLFTQPDASIAPDLLPQVAEHLHATFLSELPSARQTEGFVWLATVVSSVDVVGLLGRPEPGPLSQRQQAYLRTLIPNLCRFLGPTTDPMIPRSGYDWLAILPPRGVLRTTSRGDDRRLWNVSHRRETWLDTEDGAALLHLLPQNGWVREGTWHDVPLTRDIRRRSRTTGIEAFPLWHRAVEAVAKLHANGVTHGDLRPACLVTDAHGTPTVRGLLERQATQAALARQRTGKGRCVLLQESLQGEGTLLLASPQVLRGQEPTPADDVYALASIAYQLYQGDLLACRPGNESWHEWFRELGAPTWLVDLLRDCWAIEPRDRPADAGVVLERITEGLASEELAIHTGPVIPNLPSAAYYLSRAREFQRAGQHESALLCIERALRFEVTTEALRHRAEIHLAMDRLDDGIADTTQALRIDNNDAASWALRGRARLQQGQYLAAVSDLTQGLMTHGVAEWYGLRAMALLRAGKSAEALADADEAIFRDFHELQARLVRGVVLHQRGQYTAAIRDCTFVLDSQPSNLLARRTRALARAGFGEFDGALLDFALVLNHTPDDLEVLLARADLYREWKHPVPARADYLRIIRLQPIHYGALTGLAACERMISSGA